MSDVRPASMERITTPQLADAFIAQQIKEVQAQVGDKKVLLALSGGVDSSVVAALLIKAIGKQLVCVHVNHGLMRKGESEEVIEVFRNQLKWITENLGFYFKRSGYHPDERRNHQKAAQKYKYGQHNFLDNL